MVYCSYFFHLPASVSSAALSLGGLIQQKVSSSVLEAYFYSISWYHSFAQVHNPCSNEFLISILVRGKHILSKPLNKKEPITTEILSKLVQFYTSDENNLLRLRTCVLCLLGFSGFLRFSELSGIRLSHISWHSSHIQIKIPNSKTDIYRRSNSVIIPRTGNTG